LLLSVIKASGGKPPFPTCKFLYLECLRPHYLHYQTISHKLDLRLSKDDL
jgi:hypothetical protein